MQFTHIYPAIWLLAALLTMGCADDKPTVDIIPCDQACSSDYSACVSKCEGNRGCSTACQNAQSQCLAECPQSGLSDAGPMVDAGVEGDAASPDAGAPCDDTGSVHMDAVGPFGMGTRISTLDVPSRTDEAEEAGCNTVGTNNGTGLAGLVTILGVSLSSLAEPNDAGVIDLVLLAALNGWDAGQTANEVADVTLDFFKGLQDGDSFLVDPGSLVDGDPMNGPRARFPASVACGALTTETGTFEFGFPVEDFDLPLTLVQAQFSGDLFVRRDGFGISDGTITGYLTLDYIVELLREVAAACESEFPPSFCAGAAMFLDGDPTVVAEDLVIPLLRGADATVAADGTVSPGCAAECEASGAECDCAISVCLVIDSVATAIDGVGEPPEREMIEPMPDD